ncbi:metallophosphoesterase family protein [Brachybacterium hainanense]|uniref:Metallophosphoesterase family protein n=1 Tax=Brachybacterium hainanense TaxID=1541174 RepID=A0ABV6R767_9MICO
METPVADTRPLTASPPVVMAPREDGFEVVWAVRERALGQVEIVPADAPGAEPLLIGEDRYGFVPQGAEVLRVRVEGLEPGRLHLLRTRTRAAVDGRCETSPWREVRTLDPAADTARFVQWNDTHQHPDTLALLDERSPRADVLFWNGDVCNNWTDPAQLVPTILSPAGRDITAGRPLAFSWGNHDVRGPFAHRLPEVVATPQDQPYYALRIGPLAVIVLSTGEDKPDSHPSFEGRAAFAASRARQARWLSRQIREPGFADAPYRLVVCHMPLRWLVEEELGEEDYATGRWDEFSRASRELWHEHLVAWGAQVVLSGHTHVPALVDPAPGFPYAQVTGGGNTPEEATCIEGDAGPGQLRIAVRDLEGTVLHELRLAPLTGAP